MFEVFELGKDERDRRWQKVRGAMKKRGLRALVVWGFAGFDSCESANFVYLTNVPTFGCLALPGYVIFPLEGEPTIIGFAKMPGDKLWVNDIRGKRPTYSKAIIERLKELHLEDASIGIITTSVVGIGSTGERAFPYITYVTLQENLPKARFEDATNILDEARRIKSDAEIRCLELGCEAANAAIQTVVDTARPGVRDYEVMAKLVETLVLNGCEVDTLFLYGSGKDYVDSGNGQFLNPRYLRTLDAGDFIHTEFNAKYNNYTAQFNQPFSLGEPDKEWRKVFATAQASFNSGLKALKPGITLKELTAALHAPILEAGLTTIRPVFHGLGLTSEEPLASTLMGSSCIPYDSFLIQAGMVLELEPHIITKDGKKGTTLGNPVLVTEKGCRSLNKNKAEVKIIR
ncbi:MAG: Xaa-Pro peptidase family protein [Dehalococcoidales bacterium]